MTYLNTGTNFREITATGSLFDIGKSIGVSLATQIAETLKYYKKIWQLPDEVILNRAKATEAILRVLFPDLLSEIRGIAEGCKRSIHDILAINSRTELLHFAKHSTRGECTAVACPNSGLIGENWDWSQTLENLITIITSRPSDDRPSFITLTEPGIPGKIGFNSSGIGVVLNILSVKEKDRIGSNVFMSGLPVHCMMRAILNCKDIKEVKKIIYSKGIDDKPLFGTLSCLTIMDSKGEGLLLELAGNEFNVQSFNKGKGCQVHTNHFLLRNDYSPALFVDDTLKRAKKTIEILDGKPATEGRLQTIFKNRSIIGSEIYARYEFDPAIKDNVGTVASIIMDLKKQSMLISKGNSKVEPTYIRYIL